MLRILNEIAPMKTKLKPKHDKKPWYDTDLHDQEEYSRTERENGSNTGQLNCGPYTNEKETVTTQ